LIDVQKVLDLYHRGYSQSDIAREVGVTKSYISLVLRRAGIRGRRKKSFPEFPHSITDEELVLRGVPRGSAVSIRKSLGLKRKYAIDRFQRRRNLAKFLFGAEAEPGPKFLAFLEEFIPSLSPRQAEIMDRFYVKGLQSKPGVTAELVYRSRARKALKERISSLDRNWEEEGVVTYGQQKHHCENC